ncbi:TPA: hypothetical protein DEB29_03320 [Candidatus Wolfebacteria bacterium]|nr:hypothetical protein [Candidatus Wolfebacteria bacterium]
MHTTVKKIIVSMMCVAVLMVGLATPQKSYAIPVIDGPLNALTAIGSAANSMNWVTQVAQWAKTELWNTLRDQVVKAIVNEINKQTVAWIQGNGKPKFVSDWGGLLKDAAMEGVNQTISQTQLANLCTPFALQLKIAMIPEEQPVSQQASCTISDIVANVEDFYENFENGGWLAYGASIKPENNLYMQLVMFDDDMKTRSTVSAEKKKQEAGAGSGFLSVSKCIEDNSQEMYDYCVANNYFDTGDPNYCYDYATEAATCTKEQVQTPGDAVAGAVKNMIGSDNIYVSGVQSIISAAINAGINRMMSEGLALMTGNENPQNGFNPSTQLAPEIDALTDDDKKDLTDQVKPFKDQWSALVAQKRLSVTYSEQITANLSAIKGIQEAGVLCPPQVTENEIAEVTARGGLLTTELADLQAKLDEAQGAISRVEGANMLNTREAILATNAVKDFMDKYARGALITDPTTAYPQQLQDAKDQSVAWKGELDLVLTRLQTCRTVQGAGTPATP